MSRRPKRADPAEPRWPRAVGLRDLEACRHLWLAVLMHALRGYRLAVERHGREAAAYTEPGQWLASDVREVGAFLWVCEILQADPEAVRERLADDRLLAMEFCQYLSEAGEASRREARRVDD